ncbi:MAG: hypothetical protein ACR5LD_05385 [Symbiopectobacterium sp.]
MMAATARNAVRNAINFSGVVEANNSVGGQNGAITIGCSDGGNVAISGTVTATDAQGNGGKVNITGDSIVLVGLRWMSPVKRVVPQSTLAVNVKAKAAYSALRTLRFMPPAW